MAGRDQPDLFGGAVSGKRRGRPPGSKNRKSTERHAPGRVERALMAELRDTAIPDAAKIHLRAGATLVDVAETARDVLAGVRAVLAYLQLRQAYGLAGTVSAQLDPFAAFVAGMSTASMGNGEDA